MKKIGIPEIPHGRRFWIMGSGGAVLILLALFGIFRGEKDSGGRWTVAEKGEFVIDLLESGEVRAVNSYDVKAPMIWGNLQIVEMVDEGVVVKAGDTLAQFDETSFLQELETRKESLATAEAELKALDTEQQQRLNEMEAERKGSEYSRESAELRRNMMQFESPVKQRQAEIEYQKQMLTLDENETRLKNQKVIHTAARWRVLQRVNHNRERLEENQQQINDLTLRAPIGGMVVYNEIGGRGSARKKVAIGDKPWPSQPIISIPDPTNMQTIIRANEVDASKISIGDKVDISLDAFEHAQYTGTVSRVAKLADKRDSESQIKDFEVTVDIAEPDSLLKPGMTARTRLILGRRENVVFVPIGAVFEQKDGTPVVFRRRDKEKAVPVVIGRRNDRFIIIAEGVDPGDQLMLQSPEIGQYYALGRARDLARRARELESLKETPDSLLVPLDEEAPDAAGVDKPRQAEGNRGGDVAREPRALREAPASSGSAPVRSESRAE